MVEGHWLYQFDSAIHLIWSDLELEEIDPHSEVLGIWVLTRKISRIMTRKRTIADATHWTCVCF